jgi:hypothetical protein
MDQLGGEVIWIKIESRLMKRKIALKHTKKLKNKI